jgi:hypothetical protein
MVPIARRPEFSSRDMIQQYRIRFKHKNTGDICRQQGTICPEKYLITRAADMNLAAPYQHQIN